MYYDIGSCSSSIFSMIAVLHLQVCGTYLKLCIEDKFLMVYV